MDWDDAYANAAHIPGGDRLPAEWERRAAAFRRRCPPIDTPFGPLFRPRGPSRSGVLVFIHGGYWHLTSPATWSHLAKGAIASGYNVFLPAYPLAPRARLDEMRDVLAEALSHIVATLPGPVVLSGHSAGGHLAARLVCCDSPLTEAARSRLALCLPISGLFDLRPLALTAMAPLLSLTRAAAAAESPAAFAAPSDIPVDLWVGENERPEFRRQSRLLWKRWGRQSRQIELTVESGRHHFDMLEGLADPTHPLMGHIRAALEGAGRHGR